MTKTGERLSLADVVLEIARAEIGVAESGGPNQGTPARRYMNASTKGYPWCGGFVAYVFRKAGAPLPTDDAREGKENPLWGVKHILRVCEERGWLVGAPSRGDLVILSSRAGSDAAEHGRSGMHVGIVERLSYRTITCIEGNVPTSVLRVTRLRERLERAGARYARVPEPPGWTPPTS